MARKKELMELENPTMEENTLLDGTGIKDGAIPGEGHGTLPEAAGDGMDLNELLGRMLRTKCSRSLQKRKCSEKHRRI